MGAYFRYLESLTLSDFAQIIVAAIAIAMQVVFFFLSWALAVSGGIDLIAFMRMAFVIPAPLTILHLCMFYLWTRRQK